MEAFKNFRTYFLRGMAALLPTILTIWLFVQFYFFLRDNVSNHINRFVVKIILTITEGYDEQMLVDFWVTGRGQVTGFVLAFVIVVIIGAFLASVVGRTLWRMFEKAMMQLPVVKKIYPYIKQITDFFLAKKSLAFSDVVALQYPRQGVWSIGLVTGKGMKKIVQCIEKEFLTVFVPTSPTPFTGYVIMIPKEETIELDMTIEEAIRFTVSLGVITPAKHEAFQDEQKLTIHIDSKKKENPHKE